VTKRDINPRDPRATAQAIFRQWLPLSESVLRMVVKSIPSPLTAQSYRINTLMPSLFTNVSGINDIKNKMVLNTLKSVQESIATCCGNNEVVLFISKLMPIKISELTSVDQRHLTARLEAEKLRAESENSSGGTDGAVDGDSAAATDEIYVALARVFSGVLTRETRLFMLHREHDPLECAAAMTLSDKDAAVDPHTLQVSAGGSTTVTEVPVPSIGIYMCLGPSVIPVESAHAGNIVALYGLDQLILKTATLCTTWICHPLRAITFQAKPLVRVAVEVSQSYVEYGTLTI
jgi:ribosome assembly protein 1